MVEASAEVYTSLKPTFKGDLLRPGDDGYQEARTIWNGLVERTPGLIACCADTADIQSAVRAASAIGIQTAIRCGGHSLAGFSTCDDGLVIDLSRMREVVVDAEARRARIAGGCLLGSIDTATQTAGLVFPSGVVSHTGAAGLILGGGTGWLTRRFGLSCDNVEGFTLVTADGSIVHASANANDDLFWALRGGGGNFGVVTEFQLKLHPLTHVSLAEGLSRESRIRPLLRYWRDFVPEAPLDLKWNINLRPAQANTSANLGSNPVAANSLIWTGAAENAPSYFEQATPFFTPETISFKTLSYLQLQTMADSEFPHGGRYYTKSGYFSELGNATIDRMAAAITTSPSPGVQIELAYLGGAAAQVAASETAFGDRSAPFIMNLLAGWSEAHDDDKHISWVRALFNQLRPAMKPGVYTNFMSGDEQDRTREAYQERWERLVAVKSHYDPTNFFRLNQNIPPRNSSTAGK